MIIGHKIEKKIEIKEFMDLINGYDIKDLILTSHATFRYAKKNREAFKGMVKDYLINKTPFLVGIQYNKNYAVFYRYNVGFALKVIINIKPNSIKIVTFYVIYNAQIPRI